MVGEQLLTEQIKFRAPKELAERIEREARREGRTRSSFIRFYLSVLTEPERKRPEEAVHE